MKRRAIRIPDLFNARAHILHRPHPTVQALTRQLIRHAIAIWRNWA